MMLSYLQESMRFGHPHRCFTYRINGREYLVGPVKGVYEKVSVNSNNKAREHALLVNDRPSYVTILTLGMYAVGVELICTMMMSLFVYRFIKRIKCCNF
mgnify:CR=1 FL=1